MLLSIYNQGNLLSIQLSHFLSYIAFDDESTVKFSKAENSIDIIKLK